MNEQELNIKLATHFLGVKKIYYSEWDTDKASPMFIPSGKPWRTHSIDAIPIPNFPSSLDACFKWLVPKLDYRSVIFTTHTLNTKQHIARITMLDNSEASGYGVTPSLALCLAIEKLIDHNVNKEEE